MKNYLIAILFLTLIPLSSMAGPKSPIEKKQGDYFTPSFFRKIFYQNDQIKIQGRNKRIVYTRKALESGQTIALIRFSLAAHAPKEIKRIHNRRKTGYSRLEQETALQNALKKKRSELGRPLKATEKEQVTQTVVAAFPIKNDLQADEAEAFALIHKPVNQILKTLLDLDRYDQFPIPKRKRYFKFTEQLSKNYIRKNHPKDAKNLIAELTGLGIFPVAPNTYYQFSRLKIDKPEMETTSRYEVYRSKKLVKRGKKNQLKIIHQVPTVKVFWEIENKLKDHLDYGTYGILINSGYVTLQPYVNAEGQVFDGPGGLPGPGKFITSVTYHVYTKFDPDVPGNDVTRVFIADREKAINKFVESIADFLNRKPKKILNRKPKK